MKILNLISIIFFASGALIEIMYSLLVLFSGKEGTQNLVELNQQIRCQVVSIAFMAIGIGGYLITKFT